MNQFRNGKVKRLEVNRCTALLCGNQFRNGKVKS